MIGEGGLRSFLGPLAWILSAVLIGDSHLLSPVWSAILPFAFAGTGLLTFTAEARRFERWRFDRRAGRLSVRRGLCDLRPEKIPFQAISEVNVEPLESERAEVEDAWVLFLEVRSAEVSGRREVAVGSRDGLEQMAARVRAVLTV